MRTALLVLSLVALAGCASGARLGGVVVEADARHQAGVHDLATETRAITRSFFRLDLDGPYVLPNLGTMAPVASARVTFSFLDGEAVVGTVHVEDATSAPSVDDPAWTVASAPPRFELRCERAPSGVTHVRVRAEAPGHAPVERTFPVARGLDVRYVAVLGPGPR